jgi:membrane fusion protein (multidrug efflux system)
MSVTTLKLIGKFSILGAAILWLNGCSDAEVVKVDPPAPAVSVYEIQTKEIGNYREFVARTVASKTANLRARVEGELIKRHFNEGSSVSEGQTLLEIDPTDYQASVASATADLNSATVTAAGAGRDLARGKKIAADGYISSSELDQLITKEAQARASVKVARADLTKAELNLSYTTITAPFSGRVGKVKYNVGNVVGPNSEPLAILTLTNPINAS